MGLHERAEAIADRVMASEDREHIVSILGGAFEAAINEAQAAHVKVTRTPESVRIEIDQSLRPEAALLLMAEAQELIRVRVIAEMVYNQHARILTPNGAGGTRGSDVQFRVGKVGDK